MPYYNGQLPESMTPTTIPKNALAGHLDEETTIDEMVATLISHGIADEQIFILQGPEGVTFVEDSASFFGRLFYSEERGTVVRRLKNGETVVVIFGVDESEQDKAGEVAAKAGVTITARFGKWTYSA